MAITNGLGYQFIFGTKAQFDALLTAGKVLAGNLYFLTDTKQIYVGEDLYTGQVQFGTEFPANPSQGIIYVNKTTHEAKVFNGADWDVMIPAIATDLSTAQDTDLVNAKAIKDFITGGVGADAVNDVTYDSANQKFTVTYGDESTSELALKNIFTDVTYNGETGDFTFVRANKGEGETDLVINTAVENFLSSANYDHETHTLTMTLTDGTTVDADLGDLIDIYQGGETSSVVVTESNGTITAVVKKSETTGNILTLNEDGLFVPADYIQSVESTKTVELDVTDAKLTANVKLSAKENNAIVVVEEEGKEGLHVDISGKQDNLTDVQLQAVNSGITASLVAKYDGYEEVINGKADQATTLEGYGIIDAYTKDETDQAIANALTWKEIVVETSPAEEE